MAFAGRDVAEIYVAKKLCMEEMKSSKEKRETKQAKEGKLRWNVFGIVKKIRPSKSKSDQRSSKNDHTK